MRSGVIAQKVGMTRVFTDAGEHVPVTVLRMESCQVVAQRTQEKNGYTAVQLGVGLAKVKSGITTPEELLRVVTEVREMRTLCAGCGSAVGVDFNACPQCGKRVGGGCPHCGRAMQPGWNFCPYCARSADEVKPRAQKRLRERDRDKGEGRRELPAANVAEFKK